MLYVAVYLLAAVTHTVLEKRARETFVRLKASLAGSGQIQESTREQVTVMED